MPVLRVNELIEEEAEFNYSFTPDDDAKRKFQVLCRDWRDNSATILLSGMVPLPGSQHPWLGQTCRRLTIDRRKNSRWFDVVAEYSDKPIKPPQDPNPL